MLNKIVRRQQIQWTKYLSLFNFSILYQSGKNNSKPDTLTRESRNLLSDKDVRSQNLLIVIKPHNNICLLVDNFPIKCGNFSRYFREILILITGVSRYYRYSGTRFNSAGKYHYAPTTNAMKHSSIKTDL